MSPAGWSRVAWWSSSALFGLLLALPSVRLPGDDLGVRRFRTPPLGPDLRLGQTFTMTADGLYAIDVFPARAGERVSGDVRFELYDVRRDGATPVRIAEVLSSDVVRGASYRFTFPPIQDSHDRTYRLDLVASPAEGVAFWATTGGRYAGGSLHANGRDRWADLAFRTYAPAPSIWTTLMTLRGTNPVRAYVAIGALTAVWLLIGLVMRALTAVPPAPERAASSPVA